MMRSRMSTAKRQRIFDDNHGLCYLCAQPIKDKKWDVEHVIPWALTRDDHEQNLKPAHVDCHRVKTRVDVAAIAKVKRIRAKHIGAHKPSAWQSRWKRKINGTTVLREPT